jgi:hypothetical protein
MKITNVKAMVAKMFTVGLVAGAIVIAAPTKAQAQVSFGVRVGNAPYYAPPYARPVPVAPVYGYAGGYYAPEYRHDFDRDRDWDRRRDWERHEYYEHHGWDRRDHDFDRRDRDDYRDRDDHRDRR